MAQSDLTIVICYDISRAKIRRQVATLLEAQLCRVQMSVFEGRLHRDQANKLFDHACQFLLKGDSLRMYVLTAVGLEKSRISGGAPLPSDTDYWLL